MKLVTSREEYVKFMMKLSYKGKLQTFSIRVIICRNGKNRHQDEQASVPWKNNIEHNQDINV